MVWEFDCPVDHCDFTARENDEPELVERAQQHVGDEHGDVPTRAEVEANVIGPG